MSDDNVLNYILEGGEAPPSLKKAHIEKAVEPQENKRTITISDPPTLEELIDVIGSWKASFTVLRVCKDGTNVVYKDECDHAYRLTGICGALKANGKYCRQSAYYYEGDRYRCYRHKDVDHFTDFE